MISRLVMTTITEVNRVKRKYLLGLAVAALLLTGCDKITAEPVDLDKTVLVDELSEVVNNTLENVYKKYHDSANFKQFVLDEVLLTIAEHEFGPYDKLAADDPFKLAVDTRAKHYFYDELLSGSYTYRSIFDEKKYVVERVYGTENSYLVDANGNEVAIGAIDTLPFYKEGLFLPIVNKDNFDDPDFKLVHIDYYKHYMQDRYVDKIYREKLTEKFVKEEQTSTLGRNYARKVEYVAIKNNSNHPTAASALVNAFIDNNILGAEPADFNILANAWRGYEPDFIGNEAALLAATGLKTAEVNKTLIGDIKSDFAKIKANPDLTDKAIEDRFTGSGKYPKEVGKQIEINEVRKQSFVTKDWGIKDGGFSSLPEAIRSRLFNIGVANSVDFLKDDAGVLADAGKWEGDAENKKVASTFVRNIHGDYYLVPKTYEKGNNRNFLFFENDTFYIVKIVEAVNTAKLAAKDDDLNSYEHFKTEAEIAEIVAHVTEALAKLDATKTNALNFYMKDLKIVFHDEDVYDFFKEKFPDIFDDEKKKK